MSETHFLNVDLEIQSRQSLDSLIAAWDGMVDVLCHARVHGMNQAAFELSLYASGDSPRDYRSMIHSETLRRVAAVGAGLIVTIYPPEKEPG